MKREKKLQQDQLYTEAEVSPREPFRKQSGGFVRGFLTGIILAAAAVAVIFVVIPGVRTHAGAYEKVLDWETVNKIENLAAYIQDSYYEEVDVEDLREGLFRGLYDNLDVYSQYYSAEEYEQLYENTLSGTYCGIGAGLQQDAKTMRVTITRVYDGSPALEAGLQEGDVVSMVDEYDASSMELSDLVSHIKGEEGTSVHLVIYRAGEKLEFDIERRNMALPVVSSEMFEGNTGYIAIEEFTESGVDQFRSALTELNNQGMESLIVDLRDNPGGVLSSVCDMLDMILPEGMVVYTEDRDGNRKEYYSSDDESMDIPLVVLVNENSASASEIFAGAIQDRDAGTILGTTTYGKGVVQSIRGLEDGSAFKLTTHRYFTPGGTCIQDIGITPDVELEYEFQGGEEDTYDYSLDNQIQAALELLQGE